MLHLCQGEENVSKARKQLKHIQAFWCPSTAGQRFMCQVQTGQFPPYKLALWRGGRAHLFQCCFFSAWLESGPIEF